jgi:hypothetical protein
VVERLLPKQDIVGSSPITRSIYKTAILRRLYFPCGQCELVALLAIGRHHDHGLTRCASKLYCSIFQVIEKCRGNRRERLNQSVDFL